MLPADLLTDSFPATIRGRGLDYYRRGAVDLVAGGSSEAHALVSGKHLYTVDLALTGDGLAVSCTCRYFEDAGLCKHIWATLLCAQDNGYLTDQPDGPPEDPVVAELDDWAGMDDVDDDRPYGPYGPATWAPSPSRSNSPPPWDQRFRAIAHAGDDGEARRWPAGREIVYLLDLAETKGRGRLILEVAHRDLKRDGSWGKLKPQSINAQLVPQLDGSSDRHIWSLLLGTQPLSREPYYGAYRPSGFAAGASIAVPESVTDVLVPLLCQTGRAYTRSDSPGDQLLALSWKDGPAWEICLAVTPDDAGRAIIVDGRLQRGDERMPLGRPQLLLAGGFVFGDDGAVERLDDLGAFGWVSSIRNHGPLVIPVAQSDEFLSRLLSLPSLPRLDLPPALHYEEVRISPRPHLRIKEAPPSWHTNPRLRASLSFDYGGELVAADHPGRGIYHAPQRQFLLRDHDAEADAADLIKEMGFRPTRLGDYELAPTRLSTAVRSLINLGWHVEARGKLQRRAGATHMSVTSGIDWFEVTGEVEFEGETASMPELLAALRRGEDFVPLDDGTVGLLPQEWLDRYRVLAGVGRVDGDALRFKRTQVGVLDALLASQPDVTVDAAFARARDRLRRFDGIEEAKEPVTFVGELRGYQREGLGWMRFLQQFGFGGCLADDMGLGKTVQVLALLEARRRLRRRGTNKKPPSLVVVPKSLVFNWYREAQRFTPKLKVLNHTGARQAPGEHFDDYDVILTTYGTLRQDVVHFNESVKFDYCILDEAQAIKNPTTAAAKAARLIQAEHRLALSGTPIENHLGELWSLFEFLNPGILGNATAFKLGVNGRQGPDESTRNALAHALRPFILRRTKEQVAKDLPSKSEQTMYCELGATQRRYYDQLKNHFRRDLLDKVDRDGIERSKMLVLEALLRLRQAACHPGLIDKTKASESSAKLDFLIPQLVEVVEEGHKALVFSQFTKLLSIVRDRLDREGVVYEYLDGRTRDREARVERFQTNPDCQVFLISLKAGGLGLNLTAAEYVFLLDPWWNPAVEAQAIDRTHRIGQTRPILAYRIIARDTVEEKVLQLQDSKRALADSIITADNSLIRQMRREDLEMLLA